MDAEVISVGDELTSGQRLDTNSQWISQRLGELGIRTIRHTTVGDDLSANISAFREAAARARYVIVSGGLGPTLDDLTREAMATAFDCPLQLHEPSLAHIEQMFVRRSRPMPERNSVQAMLPQGSQPIPNPHGTAPGIDLQIASGTTRCRMFALPGVPAELKQMWQETVEPRIENELGSTEGPLRYYAIKVYGIGESDVEVKLPTLIARSRTPTVGITVSRATITLRIAGRARTEEDFQQLIQPTIQEIHTALGDLIFGSGEDELEHAVSRLLVERRMTLASVEVGASSLFPDWMLAANENAGHYYAGGLAFPDVRASLNWLVGGVGSTNADMHSDSSILDEATCARLALLARQRFGSSLAIAFGVYPTPAQLSNSSRSFEIVYAISVDPQLGIADVTAQRNLSGHPEVVTARIAKTALDLVRRQLLQ